MKIRDFRIIFACIIVASLVAFKRHLEGIDVVVTASAIRAILLICILALFVFSKNEEKKVHPPSAWTFTFFFTLMLTASSVQSCVEYLNTHLLTFAFGLMVCILGMITAVAITYQQALELTGSEFTVKKFLTDMLSPVWNTLTKLTKDTYHPELMHDGMQKDMYDQLN